MLAYLVIVRLGSCPPNRSIASARGLPELAEISLLNLHNLQDLFCL